MSIQLDWLALATERLDTTHTYYGEYLSLPQSASSDTEAHYQAGDTTLIFRTPNATAQAGHHTHFAMEIPKNSLTHWTNTLSPHVELSTHDFGVYESLYFFDPNDHCVELGTRGTSHDIGSIFEVVLEVKNLDPAIDWYTDLGFAIVDEGTNRPRVRLRSGDLDLELWEPHEGLAGAKGGTTVELGLTLPDRTTIPSQYIRDHSHAERYPYRECVVDRDGHQLWVAFE